MLYFASFTIIAIIWTKSVYQSITTCYNDTYYALVISVWGTTFSIMLPYIITHVIQIYQLLWYPRLAFSHSRHNVKFSGWTFVRNIHLTQKSSKSLTNYNFLKTIIDQIVFYCFLDFYRLGYKLIKIWMTEILFTLSKLR